MEVVQVVLVVVVGELDHSRVESTRKENWFSRLVSITDMRYPR